MSQSARLPWAVYLLFALILGVTSSPLLNERASQRCNARDVQIVKRTAIDPVYFCKWWNSDDRTRSPFLEFGPERVTAACKCIAPNKTKRTEDTEEEQGLAKRQTTDSCRREVATQFTEPWHFCNFYNAYPRTTSPFKKYTAQQLLKLCNCVQGKSVASSTKKTTSSVKTASKQTSTTVKPSSTSTKKFSSTLSKAISSSKLSSSSKSETISTSRSSSRSSSTATKKTSSSSSQTISSTKISSSSKLPTTSSKSTTSKTSSSSSSTLARSSTSSSAIPQVITITQIITVTEGPKSSLSTATSTLVTTIPVVSSPVSASSSVTTSESSSISESTSVETSETSSSSTDATTSTTGPSTSETSSSTSEISSSSTDVSSSEIPSSTESITSATPSPSIDPISAAQDIIVTSSYQPFCSELLDYNDETSTVSSTTTEVSTTTVTVTTTDLTAVTQMYKRKRDIAPITTECGHDHKLKRQAPTPTSTETSASSSETSSSDDSAQSTIVTPAALQTFPASVLSSACSAEITTTATTVTEISTESTVSTETSTKTISSTTTISIASSAPTGVIGYLEIRPVINAGAQYVRSDAATHMTDNGNDPSGRETFIITTDNKLYSVTNDAYYFIHNQSGGDNLYWSHDASQGLSNFISGPTDAAGYSQLLFQDKRTAPTGVYYKFCLASDRGGSTGSHMYFYGADADLSNRPCKLVEIYFAPTS